MANMIPISTVTVGSGGVATISFTGIPQTYTDLLVKLSGRSTAATTVAVVNIALNGSTSNFSGRYIEGTGTAAGSYTDQPRMVAVAIGTNYTASTFSNSEFYIPNYTSSNNKSISVDAVTENNATASFIEVSANLWSNTAPIGQIDLTLNAGNFAQYSTATLYGIRKY